MSRPLRVLAEITFPMIIYFSVIEISLYSVYRKLVLATRTQTKKKYRSPYSFTRNRQFISFARQAAEKIPAFFCARTLILLRALIMSKILRSKDAQCASPEVESPEVKGITLSVLQNLSGHFEVEITHVNYNFLTLSLKHAFYGCLFWAIIICESDRASCHIYRLPL